MSGFPMAFACLVLSVCHLTPHAETRAQGGIDIHVAKLAQSRSSADSISIDQVPRAA